MNNRRHPTLVDFLALVALFAASLAVHAADMAGQVQAVVGSAKLYDSAGKERDIKQRAEIRPGDRIVTGDQSLVQIKLTDGSYLSVRMNTDVALEQYRHDEQAPKESGILLKLARGALRSITGLIGSANPDSYRIQTPTATIGIRGTDHEPVFIPEPQPGETPIGTPGTYDKVNSGATVIRAATGEINIRPGQVGFVPAVVRVPPAILPKLPDFFKNLDPAKEKAAAREAGRETASEKTGGRPTLRTETAGGEKRELATDVRNVAGAAGDNDKSARFESTGDNDKSTRSGTIGDSDKSTRSGTAGDGDKSARSGESGRVSPMLTPIAGERNIGDSGLRTGIQGEGGRVPAPTNVDRSLSPTTLSPIRQTISPTTTIAPTTTTNTLIKR